MARTSPRSHSTPTPIPASDLPLILITIAVLVFALVRCLVVVFPEIYWDVDPRMRTTSAEQTILGIGPTGSAWIDMLSVLAAGIALFLHGRAGGRLAWKTFLLAIVGCGFCAWQMTRHVPGMITLGSWIAAVSLAIAFFHLAQHDGPRRWIIASLLGLACPFLLRSLVYVLWEHPATVDMFMKDEARNVAARGWQMGSPNHLLYVRRLQFADVTGAFGLSNIYASVNATIIIAGVTLAAVLLQARRWKQAILPAALAVMAGAVLFLTYSKGAALALVMGLGLLAFILLGQRWKPLRAAIAPLAMVGIVAAIGLVIIRGQMGPPPTAEGERSLLFRYHYWQAAANILTHEPWPTKLLGTGVGPFKDLYTQYKNPLNPEEVTSTHNVFVDLITMLGVGGIALSALLITWLWMAARGVSRSGADELSTEPGAILTPHDRDVKLACVLALVLFGWQFYTQGVGILTYEQLLSGMAGLGGFIVAVAVLVNPAWTTRRAAGLALFMAAGVLLVHAQVEMTFFNLQAAPLAFGLVAAAAGAMATRPDQDVSSASIHPGPLAAACLLTAGAIALLIGYVSPTMRQQAALAIAADKLREQRADETLQYLDKAIAILPRDPRPYMDKARLQADMTRYFLSQDAIVLARQFKDHVNITFDTAFAAGLTDLSLDRMRAQLILFPPELSAFESHRASAINWWKQVMKRSPHSLPDAVHLADLLWLMNQRKEAATWYQRALTIHRNSYLDPAKQLPEEEVTRIEERIRSVTATMDSTK